MTKGSMLAIVRDEGKKYPVGTVIFSRGYQLPDGRYYNLAGTLVSNNAPLEWQLDTTIPSYK